MSYETERKREKEEGEEIIYTMADSTNETPSVPVTAAAAGSSSATWRKISLPLPHLFPHLTINFRGHTPGRPPSPTSTAGSAPITKAKSGRDWKLRRQKTYDSPGCLNASAAKPPRLAAAVESSSSNPNVAAAAVASSGKVKLKKKKRSFQHRTTNYKGN